MRITNSMMTANTKANININKANADTLNTMTASGQKITRPSDDPVVAIRAMRLNTSLTQLNQYHGKNIPDADAWFTDTETALVQTDDLLSNIREKLNQAASQENVTSNVKDILEELEQLKTQFYALGNTDSAGRTVFTGYRTSEMLTFTDADKIKYEITETFDVNDLEKTSYISGTQTVNKATDDSLSTTYSETAIQDNDIYRIRLAYDDLEKMTPVFTHKVEKDMPNEKGDNVKVKVDEPIAGFTVEAKSITGLSQSDIDSIYTGLKDDTGTKAYYIPETGELILSKGAYDALKNEQDGFSINYEKENWQKGDLRPEHYFQCKTPANPDDLRTFSSTYPGGIEYNYNRYNINTGDEATSDSPYTVTRGFMEQELTYEVAYNQSLQINTHASDVYRHDIGRDIDELVNITKLMSDAESKVDIIKEKLSEATSAGDETKISNYTSMLAAAEKEQTLIKEKMHSMFTAAISSFKGYSDDVNKQISNVGALTSRLEMTKNRVSDQKNNVKKLADDNINADLAETALDYKNAQLALEAAQLAAGKIANQTLLNYI